MDSGMLNENWNATCMQVKSYEGMDASQINAFFSRLEPQAMSEGFLMLTADNEFIKTWIESHYLNAIKQALFDLFHVEFMVIIEVNAMQAAQPAQPVVTQQQSNVVGAQQMPQTQAATQGVLPTNQAQGMAPTSQLFAANQPFTPNSAFPDQTFPTQQTAKPTGQSTSQPARFIPASDAYGEEAMGMDHYILPRTPSADQKNSGTAESHSSNPQEKPMSSLTFENFVIGDSNRMAYSMAVDVAEMPGKTPLNPLFIYGKSGLGKTHLMRAIQNYICETQPHLKTVYVDSAELLSDYMDASAAHDKEKSSYKNFKTHYEEADVLLIDDIQYLQGKKQTLDIVFQIFNKLTSQGKQIVLSADRAPKNIDIDERYHSRFNQGGTIDIQPPEVETKLGIVKSFINEYRNNEGLESFIVSDDIQMYIAENSSSNIRELKSAVTKVIYQITFFNQPDLTIGDVRTLLENHFSGGTSKNLTVEDIQKEVESFFKVKHSDLIGPKRARNVVYPRQIAIYLCRQLLDLPFNDIGKKFNRDHSTAMHSVATVEELMRTSREVQEEIETLKQVIREL